MHAHLAASADLQNQTQSATLYSIHVPMAVLLKVNATGVMPVIFSSSLLALPTALARYANAKPVEAVAAALNPSGPLYLPVKLLFAVQVDIHAVSVFLLCR